jgi:hypothetical protein
VRPKNNGRVWQVGEGVSPTLDALGIVGVRKG